MQIYTEEFMALKVAIGIITDHAEDLTSREIMQLRHALNMIERAEERLARSNAKQAEVMRRRRAR